MAISKLDAARKQLDCAIHLLDSEDPAAHTLAYAAYCLLRDLSGADLRKLEDALRLREVPEFLKHADHHPEAEGALSKDGSSDHRSRDPAMEGARPRDDRGHA
jgi:hypothetical protein